MSNIKSFSIIALIAFYAVVFSPFIVFAADLELSGAGESSINGCYVDMEDGTWIEQSGDHQVCTYDTSYAIITGALDVCGSGSQQWYHNFGAAFDSTDLQGLSPGDWTNNFYTSPAPSITETTCESEPPPEEGGYIFTGATSTQNQVQQNLILTAFYMLGVMFFVVWLLRSQK